MKKKNDIKASTFKMYALVLYVDIEFTPGSRIEKIIAVSSDEEKLSSLGEQLQIELNNELGITSDDDFDGEWMGMSLSSAPYYSTIEVQSIL